MRLDRARFDVACVTLADAFFAAVLCARRRRCNSPCAPVVTERGNLLLCDENLFACRAVLALGKSLFGAGRSLCGVDYLNVSVRLDSACLDVACVTLADALLAAVLCACRGRCNSPCAPVVTERGNGFLCFEHNAAAVARTVIPYGKTRFNTRRRFCRIGRGQMSERLRSDFFISVFAVVGAHHRNLARLGTCRIDFFTLTVIVTCRRERFGFYLTANGTCIAFYAVLRTGRSRGYGTCGEFMAAVLKISAARALLCLAAVGRGGFFHVMGCEFGGNFLRILISADGAGVRLFAGVNAKRIGDIPFAPLVVGKKLHFGIFLTAFCACIYGITGCDTC